MKIFFVAPGKVGQALGALWLKTPSPGHEGVGLWSRSEESAKKAASFLRVPAFWGEPLPEAIRRADLVLLTSPERSIEPLARALAPLLAPRSLLVHTAGSLAPLEGLPEGVLSGSLHPLQSVADPKEGLRLLPGSYFAVSGEEEVLSILTALVQEIGGVPVRVGSKLHYHLGAVLASNTLYPLFDAAVSLLEKAGVEEGLARQMLLPLVRGSVENIARLGPVRGMTGPVARADAQTIASHLAALGGDPEIRAIYRVLQRRALRLAKAAGADPEGLRAIEALLAQEEAASEEGGPKERDS